MNTSIAELIDSLYQAALTTAPAAYRTWALGRISGLLDLSGAVWRRRRIQHAPHSLTPWGLSPTVPATVFRNQAQNPVFEYAFGSPGKAFSLDRLLSEVPGDGAALMRRVLEPLDIGHMAMVVNREPEAGLDTEIVAFRARGEAPFTDQHLQTLETIAPFLVGATRLSRFVDAAEPAARHWHRATAIVDLEGHLLDAQPAFLELLRTHFPAWSGSRLPFAIPDPDPDKVVALGPLAACAEPLADLTRLRLWPRETLSELTDRERAVAEAISAGHPYKEIARRLGITSSTVSNHLQRVYSKLDINSRAELTRLWQSVSPQTPGSAPAATK